MVATTSAANAGATTAPPPGFAAGPSVFLRGPIILIDGQAVLWDVPTAVPDPADATAREKLDADMYGCLSAWTPEMLQLFVLAKNKPEIVVFGTGKSLLALPAALRNVFTSNGMQLEVSSTRNACSTFNVLVAEGRHVAACLLPNTPTSPFKSAPASATASVGSAVDHESASSD
ncbi:NADH dehydrogenase 1 alpha subcomplex assembly factor 3 [Blastocladiella britannica]|nr:NADH dehydrogenase 1 alpha subcomplex assembly factor 3 [Blastocladiella britannica]